MFLLPFGQNHKSYIVDSEKDTTAQNEFKKWVENLNKSKKLIDEIHKETMKEFGERK